MTLKNDLSTIWLINAVSAIFFMLLILDIISFFIDFFLGVSLGVFLFYLNGQHFLINPGTIDAPSLISSFIAVTIIGGIFSHNKFIIEQERAKILESSAGAIAHEMRTPLANIRMNAKTLEKTAERMQQVITQDVAKKDQFLREESQELIDLSHRLSRIAQGSQNFINLLLGNLRQDFKDVPTSLLSMKEVIDKVFQEFALKPHQAQKIHLHVDQDFQFLGNEELMIHIFFNLLKNSLYFIQAAGKGEIYITLRQCQSENQVEFKDTGTGIEPHRLPHLFKPFYSRRPHGTGIGLSFCKKAIESMKGKVDVISELGEYTIFTLRLPQLTE
ncbi:MAG: sensor histidine kinase [Janthinobacterium lividum]